MTDTGIIITRRYESPFGTLVLGSCNNILCMCDWNVEPHHGRMIKKWECEYGLEFAEGTAEIMERTSRQLDMFFSGSLEKFTIEMMSVGTDFQKKVWRELLKIPRGITVTYSDIARRIGNPRAVRAVANAIGSNPMSVLVPCHRVIGSDNSLTGYAGGLEIKRKLLASEGVNLFCAGK